ncbi:MAG: filamentation induced by cAMP protein fic [Candidatus Eremiobacteraeota bacterium]|nr:filamentation induced by cAMP protein fic [Candidatus Eremiobacteraeota bacterium]
MQRRFLWEHPDWPNLRVETGALAEALAGAAFDVGEIAGALRALPANDRDGALARRLSGDAMTVDAVRKADAPLTKERLLRWHAGLLANAPLSLTVGEWRRPSDDWPAAASAPAETRALDFEPPAAPFVNDEMRAFLDWFEAPSDLPPLVHAAVAHLRFATIRPFADGNGRIASAISDLRLARAVPRSAPYVSLAAQIREERAGYDAELARAQQARADVTPWAAWFIGCYRRAAAESLRSLDDLLRVSRFWREHRDVEINARQRKVLDRYLAGEFDGRLNSTKYAATAEASPDTAQRDLADLVAKRLAFPNGGKARSTSYRLGDAFDPLRRHDELG